MAFKSVKPSWRMKSATETLELDDSDVTAGVLAAHGEAERNTSGSALLRRWGTMVVNEDIRGDEGI